MEHKGTLADLGPGESGVILRAGSDRGAVKRRLVDMGLTPGTEVTVRKIAPFGDPIEVNLRGYELSLRREDAQRITLATGEEAQACRELLAQRLESRKTDFANYMPDEAARLENGVLTLWVESDFIKSMVGKPAILETVARVAGELSGGPVRCRAEVGKPPETGAAPPEQHDNLEDLLAFGQQFDNIIIQE